MKFNFKWIGGATWILSYGNIKIACDPVLCPKGTVQDYGYFKTIRLNDPVYIKDDFENINLWLLTHNHEDHLDAIGREMIRQESQVVCHKNVAGLLPNRFKENTRVLLWGETFNTKIGDIELTVKAVPAIHSRYRLLSKIVSDNNGYILTFTEKDQSRSFYITGDDVFNYQRLNQYIPQHIDFVIANAGNAHVGYGILGEWIGNITNNENDLIKINHSIKPEFLFVVHYGTFKHYKEKSYQNLANRSIKLPEPGGNVSW